ncbi:unnamed protein product [Prorocentrum cordatum]|uniref:SCP domain-containing protein n=1 Tax=Prorocentrum cordatum TaxID=2364126 RepID=A0ABN9PQE8_9DINO|nr:unnamed protein product [Polarella glacialis]CAK0819304.1 unnamed protein product [Polarella glacialis]
MLDGMNELRMKAGLSSLCYNEKLNKAAQLHADDIRERNFWSHVGSDGSKIEDRIANVGYDAFTEGENLFGGEGVTVSDVIFGWSHHWNDRVNFYFSHFSQFGFARSGSVWVGLFALPEGKEACIQAGGGADGHGGLCRDFVPAGESSWHDSDGETCAWYAIGNHCADHGHLYKNFGHTADTACCACGRVEGGGCMDLVPDGWKVWYDSHRNQCDYYGREGTDLCQRYGGHFPNGGLTARMACCVCGGGRTLSEEPTSDFLAPPPPSSGLGCREDCQDSAECHSTLFCCPRHHMCMDPVTLSAFGSNCDKVDQSNHA